MRGVEGRAWTAAILLVGASVPAMGQTAGSEAAGRAWVEQSNAYTQKLLDIQFAHAPEEGTREGVSTFDDKISKPTLADQLAERREFEGVISRLKIAATKETNKYVREDLDILVKAFDLQFRREDFELAHEVPFLNASERVFQGLRGLLDDQVAAERRPAALVRLRKYAGTEPGSKTLHRDPEAARTGADRQSGRRLSVERRGGRPNSAAIRTMSTGSARCWRSTS